MFCHRPSVLKPSAILLGWLAFLCMPAMAQGPVPLGELFPSDASGQRSIQLAGTGMDVVSGSELSAGIAPATLKLFRGGQVRICPHSGLSISASGNGLMLATGAGAVEVDYELGAQAVDVLITPDFNVTLVGPGTYHFALGVNKKGDTCVKPMAGNASAISFSELLGTGTYKSAAEEMALFPAGKTDGHKTLTTDCGCPSTLPVIRTETAPPGPAKDQPEAAKGERVLVATPQPAASAPADQSGQVRVQVDAPFVFSAKPAVNQPYSAARLQVSSLPNVFFVQEDVDPVVLKEKPPEVSQKAAPEPAVVAGKPKKEKRGFFGRVKGFFGSMFHR